MFKLGTVYTEKMGAKFLDSEGKQQIAVMGCYGIGVDRLLAAIIEENHDENHDAAHGEQCQCHGGIP